MKVILSCTSTYERRHIFFYGVQSLLKQTLKPDLFLVNISKESFLKNENSKLPEWLKDERITINWVEDIGPYTKLLPAVDYAEEEDIIITADDDVLYNQRWLEQLCENYKKQKDAIVCARAKKIQKNIFNQWKNYDGWPLITQPVSGKYLLPTGVGGVVYNKKLLDLDFLFDSTFKDIAPTTDDLWLRMASMRKGVPVSVYPQIDQSNIYLKHGQGLAQNNFNRENAKVNSKAVKVANRIKLEFLNYLGVNQTKNDYAWEAICAYSKSI